jgi:hypothetical protein
VHQKEKYTPLFEKEIYPYLSPRYPEIYINIKYLVYIPGYISLVYITLGSRIFFRFALSRGEGSPALPLLRMRTGYARRVPLSCY